MQLFYNTNLNEKSTELTFDNIESKHIIKVLRKKEGDYIDITNGKNVLFKGKITVANERKCSVQIIDIEGKKPIRNYTINIAIAPTKNNTRFEWFLEKATEIGIDEIFPIICAHSERKIIKHDRMQKVVQTAMKQSLQYKIPILHELTTFKEVISKKFKGQKYIAQCEYETDNSKQRSLQSQIDVGSDAFILIGPEGGFSPNEIELAIENNFIPVSLGATRLRTETAGIVAVHTVALVNK